MPLHARPESRPPIVTNEREAPFQARDATSAVEGERRVENKAR